MKKGLLIVSLVTLLIPLAVFAVPCNGLPDNGLNLCYPSFGKDSNGNPITLQLSTTDLPHLIAWIYYAIVGLSGFAAFVMLVWGGAEWMSSSGNPTQTSEAKNRIRDALLGLLLVLASFLILQVINPSFTILQTPVSL